MYERVSSACEAIGECAISEEEGDRRSECRWVVRWHQQTILSGANHFGDATNVAGDHWAIGGERLDDREPLRLAVARHDHHICSGKDLRHIFAAPQEVHAGAANFSA